jgi:hypothetical protein
LYQLSRFFSINFTNFRPLSFEFHLKNPVSGFNKEWLESGQDELGAWILLLRDWIDMLLRQLGYQVRYALAILRVQGTVKLIHYVEWSRLNFLYGKNQAGSNDCFLAAR